MPLVSESPAQSEPHRIERAAHDRLERDLGEIALDGLRPAAFTVGMLFLFFAIYNATTFSSAGSNWLVACDVAIVALGFGLLWASRRFTFSAQRVHVAAAVVSLAVLADILLAASIGACPYFTIYVVVLIVSSAGSVVYTRWAVAIASAELVGWALTAFHLMSRDEIIRNGLIVMSSLAAAFIVHVGRVRALARIRQLRAGDIEREIALKNALADADEARRGLDKKVSERTIELRSELDERKRLEEQLRHSQKMEAVGRLAGGVAHDFNNLLTVIRMSVEALVDVAANDADAQEAIDDARDATNRAADLTHDLLAFARKQTLDRKDVGVADILHGMERMVRRVMPASIKLVVDIAEDAGQVLADKNQIEQVLLNLAINACDAMGDRGTLSVRADTTMVSSKEAAQRHVTPGSYVRLAVTDTGTGIDEKTLAAIFEPFFTTKEVGRGTGLGLAVAHGIVAQHGGQIEVESEVGKGSTFIVLLPRSRPSIREVAVDTPLPPKSRNGETVLLVEDEPAVRRAVQRTIERLGYRVLPANDGEDALRIAESLNEIDLLLSDVVMPGIDGPELASRLRARWPDLRVLFLTGYSSNRLARSDAVGPGDRVLQKPYQVGELARAMRGMLSPRESTSDSP
jgi:signal transduction histidine kinase/CheY-like chemotaxis protein